MADKEVFSAVRVDQPRVFTIDGENRTVNAGNYILTDTDGNYKVLSSTEFETKYADAGTGVAGEVSEVKPKRSDNSDEQELRIVAPENATVSGTTGRSDGITVTPVKEQEAAAPSSAPADAKSSKASEATGADPTAKIGPAETGDKSPTDTKG